MNDDRENLRFIAQCIDHVDRYVDGNHERFAADEMVQDAVLRRLEILSDACGRLSEQLRERHPLVPWSGVTGFRNVLAHAYHRVDVERAWSVVVKGLPLLREVITAELEDG